MQKHIFAIETGTILPWISLFFPFPFNYVAACSNTSFIVCGAFIKNKLKPRMAIILMAPMSPQNYIIENVLYISYAKVPNVWYIWNLRFWLEFRCVFFVLWQKTNKRTLIVWTSSVASTISVKEPNSLFCTAAGSTPTFISFLMCTPLTQFACFSLISIMLLSAQYTRLFFFLNTHEGRCPHAESTKLQKL